MFVRIVVAYLVPAYITMSIYEGSYFQNPVRGGCKNFNLTPSPAVTSYGPKNLDSYSSTKDINGIFDRF